MKLLLGVLMLSLQLLMIVCARFNIPKYFCWAPHDQQCVYHLSVTIDGKPLTSKQINERYHLNTWRYWNNGAYKWVNLESRSIKNVKNMIRQYEATYGKNDRTKVVLSYRINGGQEQTWQWQPQQ